MSLRSSSTNQKRYLESYRHGTAHGMLMRLYYGTKLKTSAEPITARDISFQPIETSDIHSYVNVTQRHGNVASGKTLGKTLAVLRKLPHIS